MFQSALLEHLGSDKRAWNAHRNSCLDYRNEFLAHLGSVHTMNIPFIDASSLV